MDTGKKLEMELLENLPVLIAYEGIIYEECIGGKVFGDCRVGNQVLSNDIIKARLLVRAINSYGLFMALKEEMINRTEDEEGFDEDDIEGWLKIMKQDEGE